MSEHGGKKVEIIPLTRRRKMERRGIGETWVKDAVLQPEQVVVGHGGRRVAHKRIVLRNKEGLWRVVYEDTAAAFVIVLAYYTSDVERYWENPS